MPPNCSRCARWRICTWRGKNCCLWHRLSPGANGLITGEPPKRAEDRERPNPSACTGLAEHLLPRRHELIQSFPKSAHLKSFPLSSTALKGTIHEKDNVTVVDELHRFGRDLRVGRLGPRRLGRPAAIVRRCSARHYGDSGQRHS